MTHMFYTMLCRLWVFFFFLFISTGVYAVETIDSQNEKELVEKLGFNYPSESSLSETLNLDVTNLKNDLRRIFPDEEFQYEWDIRGASSRSGESISLDFREVWEKYILLKVFRSSGELLLSKELFIKVYKQSVPMIIQESFSWPQIESFVNDGANDGVYFYREKIAKDKIQESNFLNTIENYRSIPDSNSDFLIIWWDREFIASVISQLWKEIRLQDSQLSFRLLAVSPYNLGLLESYLKNFVVEKNWLDQIILMNESAKFQIQKSPQSLGNLKQSLALNWYDHIDINTEKGGIHPVLFLSKFVNKLSNAWYTSMGIYLIVLIPFLFTFLVIIKHLIWLSPIGVLIPIWFTLMIFKLGIIVSLSFMAIFIVLNLVLARIMNNQTLLYTPKMSFLLIINIIFMILVANLASDYGLIELSINNSLFIIIYIIVLEKFVNVILSKEFSEYRPALMNSIFIGLLAYIVFSSETLTTLILSYPETILALIPLNFLIWKFSWLRVTEYFRFREIIQSVEEE